MNGEPKPQDEGPVAETATHVVETSGDPSPSIDNTPLQPADRTDAILSVATETAAPTLPDTPAALPVSDGPARATSPTVPPAPGWSRRNEWTVLGVLAVLACVFVGPLVWRLTAIGGELDWQYFQQLWETDRKSFIEFGQLPFWNPWYCGGNVHLANPQTQFFSLASPLSWVFGAAVAIKFHILLHYILGLWGTWKLARAHGLKPLGAFSAALVFAFSGFFAMRAGGGHSAFLAFFFMPWAAFFYLDGLRTVRGGLALGLCLGLMLLEGGSYAFALSGGLMALLAVFDLCTKPRLWRAILRTGALALGVCVAAAAVKVGPVLAFTADFPRTVPIKDSLNLTRVLSMFVSRSMERQCAGCVYVWPEYINYVGPVVLLVFLLGLRRLSDLRWRRAYVVALCAGLIMIGDHGEAAPYVLLHNIPPYDSLRVPGRWCILVVLQMALLFGAFMDDLPAWLSRWRVLSNTRAVVASVMLLALVTVDIMLQNSKLWSPGFKDMPPAEVTQEPFRQEQGRVDTAWLATRKNVGTLACYEPVALPTARGLWTGKNEQVRVVDANKGTARVTRFTPNAWTLEVDLKEPAVVLVNQNHHREWRVVRGNGQVVSRDGQLALDLPAGAQKVRIQYAPRWFALYALLSLLAWGLGLWFIWRSRKTPWTVVEAASTEPVRVPGAPAPAAPVPEPVDSVSHAQAPEPLTTPSAPIIRAPVPPWSAVAVGAVAAGAATGVVVGAVEAVDLAVRKLATLAELPGALVINALIQGGVGLMLGGVLVALHGLLWRGTALGRALSAPWRWLVAAEEQHERPASVVLARLGGGLLGALLFAAMLTGLMLWSAKAFNARELAAALVAVLSLPAAWVAVVVGTVVMLGLRWLTDRPWPVALHTDRLSGFLPWAVVVVAAGGLAVRAAAPILKDASLRPAVYPLFIAVLGVTASSWLTRLILRRGWAWKRVLAVTSATSVGAWVLGLASVVGVPGGKVLMERGMVARPVVQAVKNVADLDKDGYSRLLGGGDCDDGNPAIHPGAVDVPDNGVDEDCTGTDFHVPPRPPDVHNAPLPPGVGPYKNVLFIIVDTLRRDRMHLYGNDRPNTPFLDVFAKSSVVFNRNYSNCPRSHRSIPSILSGRYPSRLAMEPGATELMTLLPENVLLSERLVADGYVAATFNLEKYFENQKGLTQGFDYFTPRRVDPSYKDWSKPQAEGVVNATMKWIAEREGKPWMAWPHIYDPHLFWHDTTYGHDDKARFDRSVYYVDSHLQRLITFVKGLPDGNQTLIIIVADHGQGLGTHGEYGHGQDMWEHDVNVPLIIHAPGFPAQWVETVTESVDVVPTVLNLLGKTSGVDPLLDGKSLVPLMEKGDAAAAGWKGGVAVVEGLTDSKQPRNRRAVVQGDMKLVLDLDVGSQKLFDVRKDPLEKQDLASQHPELVKELKGILDVHTALSAYATLKK